MKRLIPLLASLLLADCSLVVNKILNCGNGELEPDEACDPGDPETTDGCDENCQRECGDGFVDPLTEVCDPNAEPELSLGCAVDCKSVCGNNIVDGREECDFGDRTPGDGCDSDCLFETGLCGNGVVDTNVGEICDGNDPKTFLGCSDNCRSICGDGSIDSLEQCDDSNLNNGDDCSDSCQVEVCGNGNIDFRDFDGDGDAELTEREECDDENVISGDGCSSECLVEFCGDGIVQADEDCDNKGRCGNTNISCSRLQECGGVPCVATDGDGCSVDCGIEVCEGVPSLLPVATEFDPVFPPISIDVFNGCTDNGGTSISAEGNEFLFFLSIPSNGDLNVFVDFLANITADNNIPIVYLHESNSCDNFGIGACLTLVDPAETQNFSYQPKSFADAQDVILVVDFNEGASIGSFQVSVLFQ